MAEMGLLFIFGEEEEALKAGRGHKKDCYDAGDILFLHLECGDLGEFPL